MRADQVMTSPAVTVRPETPIKEAAALLAERRISAVPVVDAQGDLRGIVSEADLIALGATPDPRTQMTPIAPRARPLPTRVEQVMTTKVISVSEETDVGIVAQRLLEGGVKHVPVLRGRRVVGIVSRHDLLKVLAIDDGAIEARVRAALAGEGRGMAHLGVEVRGGVVRLSGGEPGLLRVAEVLARSVPGVLDVVSTPASRGPRPK